MSKEINTASSCLDIRRLRPEDVWYRVGEAVERGGRRCQLWHVVAKERLLRRFLRPPFLGSTNTSASTVNAGVGLMTGVLHFLIFQGCTMMMTCVARFSQTVAGLFLASDAT